MVTSQLEMEFFHIYFYLFFVFGTFTDFIETTDAKDIPAAFF